MNILPSDENLRGFIQIIKKEVAREESHTNPTPPQTRELKAQFMALAEAVHDKATLERYGIFADVKTIADQSPNKKIKKYADAVRNHWKEVFEM